MRRYNMETCPPEFHSDLETAAEKRSVFGEIFSPPALVEEMLNLLPECVFENPTASWLDPGAGRGQISLALFWRLDRGLSTAMPDDELRRQHIIERMLFMVELQQENVDVLRSHFGSNANIFQADFLEWSSCRTFHYVVGNPPYNRNGFKKVPTNVFSEKTNDGETIWMSFTKKSVSLLENDGSLVFVVPAIWMRPDKAKMYNFMNQFKIHQIRCLNASETKRVFSGNAQTPTCYFRLSKRPTDGVVLLDDAPYRIRGKSPIPVFGAAFINRLKPFVAHYGTVVVKKTNMPARDAFLSNASSKIHRYANITTAKLNGLAPQLIVNYSTTPLAYHGVPKVVLPHKMYGFPFLDREGKYGISNRDNYVIQGYPIEALELFCEFLSTKTALYLFECTRYRMRYLEKEAFMFMPDLTRLPDLPRPLTDISLSAYFGFALEPVLNLHHKEYSFSYM